MKTAEEIMTSHTLSFIPKYQMTNAEESTWITECMQEYAGQFKPKWVSVEIEKPLCYKSGNWDGLNSDFVLFKTHTGLIFQGGLNEGVLDGVSFSDWYKNDGFLVENVTQWMPIPE